MPRSPEIFDPYVGKVYGNILDQYDNATYNLKLSIIPGNAPTSNSASQSANTTIQNSGVMARETTPSGNTIPGTNVVSNLLESNPLQWTGNAATGFPPKAGTGTLKDNLTELKKYLLNFHPTVRVAENKQLGLDFSNVHKGSGHNYYDSAIDVNIGTGNPAGEKELLTKLNASLKQAGYKTLWQVDGHMNHLHVEVPKEFRTTQEGWRTGVMSNPSGNASPNGNTTGNSDSVKVLPPVPDNKQVIIAQTGVTAVTIDNLEMSFAYNKTNNSFPLTTSFTLTQPGAANLIDQMRLARAFVGGDNSQQFHFLLEITFVGYGHNPEYNEQRGDPQLIAGPFIWFIETTQIEAEVTASGSVYNITAMPYGRVSSPMGLNDVAFRLPAQMKSTGKTITEHVKSLETALNTYLEKNSTNYSAPDQYKFDLSGLLASSTTGSLQDDSRIKDETVADATSGKAEQTNVPSNSQNSIPDAEQASDVNRASKKVKGTASEQLVQGSEIVMSEQGTFTDYFTKLLSMNTEFRSKISTLKNIDDPGSEADPTKLFTSWFTIEVDTELKQYDPRRGTYTKAFTIRPVIYRSARPDIQRLLVAESTTNEAQGTSELAANSILEGLIADKSLHKSYQYLYTGLNDQIIDLNIKMDTALTLTAPPRGGFIGDSSVTNAVALNPTLPANSALDIFSSIKNTVDKVKNAQSLVNLIKNVSALDRENLAAQLGLSSDQLKAALADSSSKAAQSLAAQVDAATLARASRAAFTRTGDSNTSPTSGTTTNLDGTPYTPDTSGRIYAEDLINANFAGALTLDQVTAMGRVIVDNKTPDEVFNMTQAINSVNTVSSPAESSTYSDGGIGNTLFSYIHQQQTSGIFLQTLELTVRGDPWYLGTAYESPTSTPDQAKMTASNLNYLLLTIASPLPFDLDSRDEDNNSGYWNMNGLSQSFSGIYFIIGAVNKFSNGVYTCEITGSKHLGVPLYKIRPMKPGETPENYVRNGVDISAKENAYRYVAGNVNYSPVGDATTNGPTGGPADSKLPAATILDPALEEGVWNSLEVQEKENRLRAGLPAKFSLEERRAINGILASEGGDPGYNLATMLNRSYQTSKVTGIPTPVNEIVFAKNQFTPAAAASVGVND